MAEESFKSPLHQMTETTDTCLWNDSVSVKELSYSIEHGAVGATCNPVIVVNVLKSEMAEWRDTILGLIDEHADETEDEIGWRLVELMSTKAAKILMPAFEKHNGKNGRLAIQTDPRFFRDSDRIVEQAVYFSRLAPNITVKIPVTRAGVAAMEEATYRGVSVTATVCFTAPQCIAAAEAVQRGLERRKSEGKEVEMMGPVCALMVGRLDDWLKLVADRDDIVVDPGVLDWAGVAVFKKTYRIFKERNYPLRLLSAAFRNHLHWSELIGGDCVVSATYGWQKRFNASDVAVQNRMDDPVDPHILDQLSKFEDFTRANDERDLKPDEFDTFGATRRTLRQFVEGCCELSSVIRDFMIPNPDN